MLGIDNMSSDETDTEDQNVFALKRVRPINVPWLHDDIVGLKRSLEKLDMARRFAKVKVGNKSCVRMSASSKVDTRRAPNGLPFNWYNPSWRQTLTDLEKTMLEPGPVKPIPELVSLF